MASCDDLGAELWALVYHLFIKYKNDAAMAVRELGLRTHREVDMPVNCASPLDLKTTKWYTDMCAAFKAVNQSLRVKHEADAAEARDLVLSLYPDGCNVSEYADAVRTSAAVLPCTVPTNAIDYLIHKRGTTFLAQEVHAVTGEMLLSDVIEELMFGTLVPRRWWHSSSPSVARVRRVGLKGRPPTLLIEYERPMGVPHVRRIPLGLHLRENAPTAQLARRLAATHEALLSEAQFQSLLIRCQRLLQQSAAPASPTTAHSSPLPPSTAGDTEDPTMPAPSPQPPATSSTTAPPSEGAARSVKAQKADLGLLYRDPDAALQNVDLNDADDVTLREFKEVMNEKFNEHVIKPGDPGYVYDKRLAVTKPVQRSEWDDDSDEDQ